MGGNSENKSVDLSLVDKLKRAETSLREVFKSPSVVIELNDQEEFIYNASELIQQADDVAPLINGPLNKTKSTREYETLVKHILRGRRVDVHFDGDQVYLDVKIKKQSKKYHLNALMNNTYFPHIQFGITTQTRYNDFLKNHTIHVSSIHHKHKTYYKPYQEYLNEIPEAYQIALRRYSSEHYVNMNNLLRGNYEQFRTSTQLLIICVVDVAMANAALNVVHERVDLPPYVLRNEAEFKNENKQKRVNCINSHAIEYNRKLISTSIKKYSLDTCEGVYLNPRGQYIAGISLFQREHELLMPPTQLRWLAHHNKNHFVAQVVETPVGIPEQECYVPPVKPNAVPAFKKPELSSKRTKIEVSDSIATLNPLDDMEEIIHYLNVNFYSKPSHTMYNAFNGSKHQRINREHFGLAHVLRSAYLVPFVAKLLYPRHEFTLNEIRRMQLALLFSEVSRGSDSPEEFASMNKLFYIESALVLEHFVDENEVDCLNTPADIDEVKNLIISLAKTDVDDETSNYENIIKLCKDMAEIKHNLEVKKSDLENFAINLRLATEACRESKHLECFSQGSDITAPVNEDYGTYYLERLQQVPVPESLIWHIRSEHPIADSVEWFGKKLGFC